MGCRASMPWVGEARGWSRGGEEQVHGDTECTLQPRTPAHRAPSRSPPRLPPSSSTPSSPPLCSYVETAPASGAPPRRAASRTELASLLEAPFTPSFTQHSPLPSAAGWSWLLPTALPSAAPPLAPSLSLSSRPTPHPKAAPGSANSQTAHGRSGLARSTPRSPSCCLD